MALENIISRIFKNNNSKTTQLSNEFYNLVLRFTNLKRKFKELTLGVQGQEWNIDEDINIDEETLEKYHNYLSLLEKMSDEISRLKREGLTPTKNLSINPETILSNIEREEKIILNVYNQVYANIINKYKENEKNHTRLSDVVTLSKLLLGFKKEYLSYGNKREFDKIRDNILFYSSITEKLNAIKQEFETFTEEYEKSIKDLHEGIKRIVGEGHGGQQEVGVLNITNLVDNITNKIAVNLRDINQGLKTRIIPVYERLKDYEEISSAYENAIKLQEKVSLFLNNKDEINLFLSSIIESTMTIKKETSLLDKTLKDITLRKVTLKSNIDKIKEQNDTIRINNTLLLEELISTTRNFNNSLFLVYKTIISQPKPSGYVKQILSEESKDYENFILKVRGELNEKAGQYYSTMNELIEWLNDHTREETRNILSIEEAIMNFESEEKLISTLQQTMNNFMSDLENTQYNINSLKKVLIKLRTYKEDLSSRIKFLNGISKEKKVLNRLWMEKKKEYEGLVNQLDKNNENGNEDNELEELNTQINKLLDYKSSLELLLNEKEHSINQLESKVSEDKHYDYEHYIKNYLKGDFQLFKQRMNYLLERTKEKINELKELKRLRQEKQEKQEKQERIIEKIDGVEKSIGNIYNDPNSNRFFLKEYLFSMRPPPEPEWFNIYSALLSSDSTETEEAINTVIRGLKGVSVDTKSTYMTAKQLYHAISNLRRDPYYLLVPEEKIKEAEKLLKAKLVKYEKERLL